MSGLLEYKCPSCGGLMEFDSQTQKMKCPSCGTLLEVDNFEEITDEQPEASVWKEGEQEGMRIYGCNACGGEIIADQNTAATTCPYCGSNVVMKGQFKDKLKPDYVIPFQLDKQEAQKAYRNHLKGKKFVPPIFLRSSYIDEIKGLYVPFWLYDATVDADITYHTERHKVWTEGDTEYRQVREYSIHRDGTVRFEKVPADASKKTDHAMMESLEPYDASALKPFKPAYLAGYYADRYDVTAEEGFARAEKRIIKSTEDAFYETVKGFDVVNTEKSDVHVRKKKGYYALYPVWMLSSRWKGEIFTFAMNAQTGNLIGDLPFDRGSFWRYIAIRTVIIGIVLFAVMWIFLH